MQLPHQLSASIQKQIEDVDRASLIRAAEELTQQYKAGRFSSPAIRTQAHRAAYLAVRMPATFAANLNVFSELHRLAPEVEIKSILDLGSGPGTAVHAAAEIFPSLTQATLLEMDSNMIAVGKSIAGNSSHPALRNSNWLQQDLAQGAACAKHDLVVISYALGELPPAAAARTALQAWECAGKFLALIEPGTRRGFSTIHEARSALIAAGGQLLAPCPHAGECPMAAAGDWCHFAQRLERTSLHRQIKSGALGHEDEKFSYVVFSRTPAARAAARIVRHPHHHAGHVQLTLCTPHGLTSQTIGKSQKETYKLARKAAWGGPWNASA